MKKFNIGLIDNMSIQDLFEFKVYTKGLIENAKKTTYMNR
jgi:hypothetical protein